MNGGRQVGIDIGSRTIKVALVEDGRMTAMRCGDSGFDPLVNARALLQGLSYDRIMATGYGRHLFEVAHDTPTVTEIKAHATGMRFVFPETRLILDIGGQDSKVIALDDKGKISKFEMNDRCAAGTGKFLEIMARTLGFTPDDFGREALAATGDLQINSMCTVFAESEVTSLLAKGAERREIAMGVHRSVLRRALGMLKRFLPSGCVAFSGGVARNPCMVHLLREAVPELLVPEFPQMTGAIGAALLANQ